MNDIIEEKSVLVPLYYDEVYRFYSNDLKSDFKTNSFNALLLKEAKKYKVVLMNSNYYFC